MGAVAWLIEVDGGTVPAEESSDAVTDGNFLVIAMPISYISSAPDGRRTIACASVDEQMFGATLSLGEYNYY